MVSTLMRGAVIPTSFFKGFPRACIRRSGTYSSHASFLYNLIHLGIVKGKINNDYGI